METSRIEKMDRSRYNLLKWSAVGWAIWFGSYITHGLIENKTIVAGTIILGLVGMVLWATGMIKLYGYSRIVKADSSLRNALNDEWHQQNTNKSFVAAYAITVGMIALFMALSPYYLMPAMLMLKIIMYISVLSALLSALLYNRPQ